MCGADAPSPSPYRQDPFAVVRCGDCRLWYLSPRLTESEMLAHYARGDYYEGGATGYDSYANQEKSLRATFRSLLKRLARRGMTGRSVLDVGCGYGFFLQEAAPFFDFRAGTEMSPAADRAETYADTIYRGGLEAIPAGRKFDCIVALHVVEHIYDPIGFLETLRPHLNGGGVLLVAVPHMNGFWRHVLGHRWPSFKYPEHVTFYDADTLRRLMRQAGFARVDRVAYPHAFPLGEICAKLGLPMIAPLRHRNVWLPATTVAMAGRIEAGETP